jgi:ADP-ribose pyrophosphatase YjhB (NUDIX family)
VSNTPPNRPVTTVLTWAREVQAVAKDGVQRTPDPFDGERFEQIKQLADSILAGNLNPPLGTVRNRWDRDLGHETPKVDVRGAVFDADRILLVRERSDGRWSLPGGWVDVNDGPAEATEREIFEESGYEAKAIKLAMLVDRNQHPHPPSVDHIYKLFFLCELTGGAPKISNETDGVDFFALTALPELSVGRTLASQIARLYEHQLNRSLPTDFD